MKKLLLAALLVSAVAACRAPYPNPEYKYGSTEGRISEPSRDAASIKPVDPNLSRYHHDSNTQQQNTQEQQTAQ